MMYRPLFYLRPAGAERAPRVIVGAWQEADGRPRDVVEEEEMTRLGDRLVRKAFVREHVEGGRALLIRSGDVQTVEVEVRS